MSSSTTTKVTTVRDKLNSPTLGKAADELLASDPSIRPVDVIAVK